MKLIRSFVLREKRDVFLSVLFGFLAGMGAVALFANSGYLISRAAIEPPLYVLTVTIALLKLFSFTRGLSRYGERLYSHRATFTMLSSVRTHFFRQIAPLAPRITHRFQSGDLLSRIVGDVESLQNYFLRVFYPPVVMAAVFTATIAFTVFFSPAAAALLVGGVLLAGWILPAIYRGRQQRASAGIREARGKLSTDAAEFFYGYQDLKLFQKLDDKEEELLEAADSYVGKQRKAAGSRLAGLTWNQSTAFLISWLVLVTGVVMTANGTLDGIYLAMLMMISLTVFENAVPMAQYPSYAEESRQAAARLDEAIEEEQQEQPQRSGTALKRADVPIRFDAVQFTYPGEVRPVIKDVSFTLPAGSRTAVVGASGSGKSTLAQLMLGIYLPEQGTVSYGNVSTGALDETTIWPHVNAQLQEQHFFAATVRDNLFAEEADDADLQQVLEQVRLGYLSLDTLLEERAANLSGGERRRLGTARLLLRQKPVWILDEPAASVDAATAAEVGAEIEHASAGSTFFLISHDLSGLEAMDQILVMEEGRLVESGTYQELMRRQGSFYQMKLVEAEVVA
ncbi:thiol reductant ABC exporter subunit CydC [Alkalicoccus luteus]|uniref:Thiol reductant ABC exporter subunit CydC n=1 Tax=Alkalicoccus luteus TaxID=1237094 RepID=A0A969PPN5_9BACI|nr:thiol reductant ABC exporter subunit CydC [Alkalicoccus luteus]NJP38081.1 thiol reductant ABC exporter subunit CydC [Alkalicoccus luteus]